MKNHLQRLWPELLPVAGFLLLPLILYWNVTVGQQTMLPVDNLYQWAPWSAYAEEMGVTQPQNSLISDLIIQNYPWKRFLRNSIADGEIPLWNPNLFAGAPFLASGQNSSYYPFTLLFLILPLPAAYGWYALSQLWLAGLFAYLFLRVLRLGRPGSFLGGVVFQGSGFMLVSAAVFPMIIGAAAWLPLLLAAVEMIVRRSTSAAGAGRTLPWLIVGAAGLGCQLLAGHPEITYYTLLVMGLYAGWRLLARWQKGDGARRPLTAFLRPAGYLLTTVLLGLLLGAIQLIPLFEVGTANFREGSASFEEVQGWAFPERRLLTLLLPDFFGNPADHDYLDLFSGERVPLKVNYYGNPNPHGPGSSSWGIKNYVEGGIYLGILPLLLTLLATLQIGAALRRRRMGGDRPWSALLFSPWTFFIGLSLLSLAFIFGTPLYALLYYGLPFINQLHSPFRWIFPMSLCVAALAAYGLDRVATGRKGMRSANDTAVVDAARPCGWLGTGALAAGLLALLGLAGSRLAYDAIAPLVERLFLGLAQAPDAFPSAEAFFSYQAQGVLLLGVALLGAGTVLRLLARRSAWGGRLAALVLIADLALVGYGFNAAVDPALLRFEPQLVQWLQAQPGQWRLTSFAPKTEKPFNANSGWLYDLQDVRGYDSIILKDYTEYMATIEPQGELLFNRIQPLKDVGAIDSPLVDLLGVRYIITHETLDLPKLSLAWEGEGVRVYENLAVAPRAFTLPATAALWSAEPLAAMARYDPRSVVVVDPATAPEGAATGGGPPTPAPLTPAELLSYGSREVVVEARLDRPGWLVLTDTYFQGWRAFGRPAGDPDADEQELPIVEAYGLFRAVELPAGAWEVRFRYSPTSFQLGGLASLMGIIIIAFGAIVWGWRRFYHQAGELSTVSSIAKNSLAPMALNLFNRGIDFFFALFYLRQLGPEGTGGYATAVAIAGFYEIMANFGLNTLLIREVSVDRSRAARYLLNTTLLRIATGLFAALPIFLYIATRSQSLGQDIIYAVALLMVGMVLSGMGQGLTGLFYAYELAERPAAVATVTTILKVGFGVAVLLAGFGFVGLAGVSIATNLVTLLLLLALAWRQIPMSGPWRLDWTLQRQMVVASYPLMINHLLATVFFRIDVLMLQQINGDRVVGWYNSAYKWVDAFNIIPSFFTFALFPIISRQVKGSIDEARRTFRMSIKLLTLVALPLAASTMLAAPLLIGVLGGAEFLPDGAITLQIVIWSIPIGWINSVTNYVLVALGQERVMTRAFLIGVLFNVVANALLLPRYSYVAAAGTTIASEIVLLLVFNYYLRPKMPQVDWRGLLTRPLLLAAGLVAVMVAAAQLHWVAGLVAGVPAYLAGLWLLGLIGDEERHILREILPVSVAARLRL